MYILNQVTVKNKSNSESSKKMPATLRIRQSYRVALLNISWKQTIDAFSCVVMVSIHSVMSCITSISAVAGTRDIVCANFVAEHVLHSVFFFFAEVHMGQSCIKCYPWDFVVSRRKFFKSFPNLTPFDDDSMDIFF